MQGNVCFSASFNVLSLAGSNNLLTHTHSHRQSDNTLNAFSYARAKRVAAPINKGLHGVPFVRFFVLFCQVAQERMAINIFTLKTIGK